MTTDDIKTELAELGFHRLETRVRSTKLGTGTISTAGNGGWGVTYDLDSGWVAYQEYQLGEFLRWSKPAGWSL